MDALCGSNGLNMSSTFVVKFQQYDNYAIATDGFAFDDIREYKSHLRKSTEQVARNVLSRLIAFATGESLYLA